MKKQNPHQNTKKYIQISHFVPGLYAGTSAIWRLAIWRKLLRRSGFSCFLKEWRFRKTSGFLQWTFLENFRVHPRGVMEFRFLKKYKIPEIIYWVFRKIKLGFETKIFIF